MDTDFAHRLKELRISKDLTQKEFSELLKISQSAISMYESGQREPTMEVLDIFAKFFKVDVSYKIQPLTLSRRVRQIPIRMRI